MDSKQSTTDVPVVHADDQRQRKTISVTREQRISHRNLVPEEILYDEFLNSLIDESLPKNYNFEIHKTIWKIKQADAKRILLQLPEGLIRFGPIIVDIIRGYFHQHGNQDVQVITMGDLTYGACCIDDYLATSMHCDLIVHYAHSCLVPINQMSADTKYLYVFLDIRFDLEHIVNCIRYNFDAAANTIALASTIQFLTSVHEISRRLKKDGYKIVLPQSRPLSSGEVLGCTAPRLKQDVDTIVFVCDGRFHLEALMIANPTIRAFRYDPYTRKLTREAYAFDKMYELRSQAIKATVEVMKTGGTCGFILGTLGRQGNENVFDRMIDRLRKHTKCNHIKVLIPEVSDETLRQFTFVDAWIQVACPRLSIDWGSSYNKPLINPYEFAQSLKILLNRDKDPVDISEKNYPMDFYARDSAYDHTPNHVCSNNSSCHCSSLQ